MACRGFGISRKTGQKIFDRYRSDTGAQETKRIIKLYALIITSTFWGGFGAQQATTDSAIKTASRDTVYSMRAAKSIALGSNTVSAARRPFLPVFQSYRLGMVEP